VDFHLEDHKQPPDRRSPSYQPHPTEMNMCQLQIDGFDELMPKTLATATVDRLLHHAHLCQTTGDSIRLSQALTGKGVIALA
jgi:IstB-like ATP binding protein